MSALFDLFAHPIILSMPERLVSSAWNGHIPFGMLLTEMLAPGVLVELGTYSGASYCAFCQAIEELGLKARATAVDDWRGDEHSGYYGDEVLADLKAYHDARYGHFSTLLRSTFDEAAALFEPGTIDLLHIDGLHTYEAVSHDFRTWLPRMSARGVMLFHDIAEDKPDFGVQQFWNEIKAQYNHYEMWHSSGLGVLLVGSKAGDQMRALLNCTDVERAYLNRLFLALGSRIEVRVENERLASRLRAQEEGIERMERELIDFYQLARNPLVRLVRGSRRYGTFGLIRRGTRRLLGAE